MFESTERRKAGDMTPNTLPGGLEAFVNPSEAAAVHTELSREVRDALQYMSDNYAEGVTLKDLGRLTNRSPFQVIRAFRRELGTTPHSWLIQFRVLLGTSLLKDGIRIAIAASEAGFVDQAHFTRHFKRLHGETPRQYCRSAQGLPAPRAAAMRCDARKQRVPCPSMRLVPGDS